MGRPGYLRALSRMIDIDLAANADSHVRHVDSRLDGEEGSGDQLAVIVGFEVIEVGSIAVDAFVKAVAGAVDEIFSIAGLCDHAAGNSVEVTAANFFATGEGLVGAFAGCLA